MREFELELIKFRNNTFSLRNFFIIDEKVFYIMKYHKIKASTQYSYFIMRYLPRHLAKLMIIYIIYIHLFYNLLFNQISVKKNSLNENYLFYSKESNDKYWDDKKLMKIMQCESETQSGFKINIFKYCHIIVMMTWIYMKKIIDYFAKNDIIWQKMLNRNKDFNIYAWQIDHQRAMNNSIYDLDQAYSYHL